MSVGSFAVLHSAVVAAETAAGMVADIDIVVVTVVAAGAVVAVAAAGDYTAHTLMVAGLLAAADT